MSLCSSTAVVLQFTKRLVLLRICEYISSCNAQFQQFSGVDIARLTKSSEGVSEHGFGLRTHHESTAGGGQCHPPAGVGPGRLLQHLRLHEGTPNGIKHTLWSQFQLRRYRRTIRLRCRSRRKRDDDVVFRGRRISEGLSVRTDELRFCS